MASGSMALAGVASCDVGCARLLRPLRTATDLSSSLSPNPARAAAPLAVRCEAPPSMTTVPGLQSTAYFLPTSTSVLDEPFPIVSNSVATGRAAAAEALALAKAAALAACEAAALAEADDLSCLTSLSSRSPAEEWDTAGFLEAGGLVTGAEGGNSGDWGWDRGLLPATAADLIQTYISDKQKLSSAFAAPSAQPVGEAPSRQLGMKASGPEVLAVAQVRLLVQSGKKGRRTSKARKTVKAASEAIGAESQVQKMLVMGVPGSLRDLMDSTPGASGLLKLDEEVTLTKAAQVMFALEAKGSVLKEELGRRPSREEWARAVGMSVAQLEKTLQTGQKSKQRMISSNMGLVISTARKYSSWGLSLDEILTRGCSGLIKAVEKFDHSRGFRFSTYAHWWIRQSIGRSVTEQSRTVRMPPHVYELLARVSKARDMLVRELGRTPADEEVAELVGMSATRLRKVLRSAKPMVSFDKPCSMDSELTLGSSVASPEDNSGDIGIERGLLHKDLESALHTLLPREREVLRMRYGMGDGRPRTLEEVGVAFRVTRERIRQLEHRALRKLRHPERSAVLKEYV